MAIFLYWPTCYLLSVSEPMKQQYAGKVVNESLQEARFAVARHDLNQDIFQRSIVTTMNLNVLEKLARQIAKGDNVTNKSNEMLSAGFITPAEHRSVTSLSWQIAANVRATGGTATITGPKNNVFWNWI